MKIIINYIGDSTFCLKCASNLEELLNVEIRNIPEVIDLFKIIGNIDYHSDIIMIDIERIFKLENATVFSIVDTLSTIINCTCSSNNKTKLVASVSKRTDILLIKQILGTSIDGIYPAGDDFTTEEKSLAITDIINGNFHIPKQIKLKINNCKKHKEINLQLTPRQEQIVTLIKDRGASNKIIAKTLNITESTVKLHVTHIFKKYGVRNRTQLAVFLKK